MKEAVFVKQNLCKWREYEDSMTQMSEQSPDTLADMYTDLTSDLAFAQTHFPESRITQYLNHLSLTLHNEIYKGHHEKWSRLLTFWTREVPRAMYGARREMLTSLVVFCIALLIGVLSTLGDESFARIILGDGYVDMTIDNIRNGVPTNVYSTGGETESFLMIAFNNLRVGIIAFGMGVFTSLGTGYILVYNGIMVGSFLSFFVHYGVFGEAFLAIMQHGTLEISTIVLEGGAGIVLGNGWLFPGTYSRIESFKRSAKRGLKIAVGVMPVVILAAFIEGFITRHVEYPLELRIMVIVLSAAFILYYYVLLPYKVGHRERES